MADHDTVELVAQSDVEAALLRPLTTVEGNFFPALAAQAVTRLRGRVPTLDARIAAYAATPRPANAIDPAMAATVLASVITRKLNNPKGAASTSDTDGPHSHTESFASYGRSVGVGDPGELQITDSDIAALNAVGAYTGGAFRSRPNFLVIDACPNEQLLLPSAPPVAALAQIPTFTSDFSVSPGEEAWALVPAGQTLAALIQPEPAGQHVRLKNLPESQGPLAVRAADGMLIDGGPVFVLQPGDAFEFDSDGTRLSIF